MSKPGESDFADRIRHWRMHQAGSLMLNFLPFPSVIYSSISPAVIRPSLSNILPLSSQDRKNQSHICIVKWKKESCKSKLLERGYRSCKMKRDSPELVLVAGWFAWTSLIGATPFYAYYSHVASLQVQPLRCTFPCSGQSHTSGYLLFGIWACLSKWLPTKCKNLYAWRQCHANEWTSFNRKLPSGGNSCRNIPRKTWAFS